MPGRHPEPLGHPDPRVAADAAAVENLLRCWVRETGLARPETDVLRIPLAAGGGAVRVLVRYWSPTGAHLFGRAALEHAPENAPPVDAITLAALLGREAAYTAGVGAAGGDDLAAGAGAAGGGSGVAESAPPPLGAGAPSPDAAGPSAEPLVPSTRAAAAPTVPVEAPPGAERHPEAAKCHDVAGEPEAAKCRDARGNTEGAMSREVTGNTEAAKCREATGNTEGAMSREVTGEREAAGDRGAVGAAPEHPEPHGGPAPVGEAAELVGRVADSIQRTALFLKERRAAPADPPELGSFLNSEQALILGHPLHPTPKSREGLSEAEARHYSPELRGSFPLHWIAVDRSLLAADSAWTQRGRTVPAERLAARLAGAILSEGLPSGAVPLPLHPWQAREIRHRPAIAALFADGLLRDIGQGGPFWHPTSSVRTVYRPDAPAMLKLSLGVRITNSRRENLRKELRRGVEVHRLLRSGVAEQWRAACPGPTGGPGSSGVSGPSGFDIVRDPAWLGADGADGAPLTGLDVVIRHNPFGPTDDAVCVAGLTAPRPWPGQPAPYSRLASIVARLAARTGRPLGAVSAEWFLRYLHAVVRPVLWLDGEAGVALEAHQQNTLVLLDPEGWPAGGRYRDNQGYYFRESHRAELDRRLPGIGRDSDTFVSDEVADERFTYYLGVNNVLGLVGAFGSQRLADERVLLAAFRRFLGEAATGPAALRSTLPARLLETPVLRCKANMLTRLRGLDELVGPVDTQSVYVTIANPLVSGTA
ncbi:iron transporter [Streptomyces sp. LX-29]|uniref:IucA/IucC family protein n=1 Tax=Streptomyces sp. LX-29 TaxID=2900152 RepID=UPI00240D6919|nr:IucA/IucC family protein [Streptomyces sp. LX-29]WFB11531.1 iron transporter [Streptomyces sp. LX-29]